MSINNVQLTALAIAEWYKDALLTSPDAAPAAETPMQAPVPASRPIAPSAPTPQIATTAPTPPIATATPTPPIATTAPPTPPAVTSPTEPAPYKFLGNNRKQIAIIIHSPGTAFLPDNQLSFLTKILEACRMNIGDIAIVNTATTPILIAQLRQQLNPNTVLLFGLEPVTIKLPINFPLFRLQPYDACTYLSAPALSLLVENSEESKLLKSKLWICLKTLFNV
jgi:hypothetical protein